jgi:ferritin
MKIIEKLSEYIDEEIRDAMKYAKCANQYKDENAVLADLFIRLADEEMKHMMLLHNEVVDIINDYKKKNGEPPEAMKTVYDILHRRHIDKAAEAKAVISMYKGV